MCQAQFSIFVVLFFQQVSKISEYIQNRLNIHYVFTTSPIPLVSARILQRHKINKLTYSKPSVDIYTYKTYVADTNGKGCFGNVPKTMFLFLSTALSHVLAMSGNGGVRAWMHSARKRLEKGGVSFTCSHAQRFLEVRGFESDRSDRPIRPTDPIRSTDPIDPIRSDRSYMYVCIYIHTCIHMFDFEPFACRMFHGRVAHR